MSAASDADGRIGTALLARRRALVTGASRGIGAAIAAAFHAQGAAVALHHEPGQHDRAADLARRLTDETGARCEPVAADLADPAAVRDLAARAVDLLGGVDIVVHNAARSVASPWRELSTTSWDATMAVNVRAGAQLCQALATELASDAGSVIVVGSIQAATGTVDALDYVTSKAALVGLTHGLARELGPSGVRVNCVAPGAIRTEAEVEKYGDDEALHARLIAQQCLPRRGTPDDVADVCVFLASRLARFVTGQTLVCDGGWVLS